MSKEYFSIFIKDWKSELRSRYSINSLGMFILVTISVILFSIGEQKISAYVTAGLYWTAVFFSAMSGLSRVFVSEEERGTALSLKICTTPEIVFTGKFLFNLLLSLLINLCVTLLFVFFFESFLIKNLLIFLFLYILGSIGISIASTIIAAIISKANSKSNLYAVLSFPVMLPLILMLLELTKKSMDGVILNEAFVELGILICYDVIMITGSFLLFEFVWKD